MAQDCSLLAPVEIGGKVALTILLVVEHFTANVADIYDFAISIDGNVSL